MRGSKKLWNVLLPSSSVSRQGDRSREEPVTTERSPTGSDSLSVEEVAEVGSLLFQGGSEEGTTPTEEIEEQRNTPRVPFMSKEKEKMRNNAIGEDGEGVKGFVGYSHSGSSVSDHPSYQRTEKKGLSLGGLWMTKVGIFQVSAHHTSQPSLPLRYPFSGVAPPYQSPFDPDLSISAFHSQFPMKNRMAGMNLMSESFTMIDQFQLASRGPYSGRSKQGRLRFLPDEWIPNRRTKRRVVKDFLRLQNPDVVMFQETKREVCDRRFVGSVWSVRNKEWAILPACGASGGILIIWDSKKMRGEEVVIGSFSVSVKFLLDGSGPLWLSAVYGPNNPQLGRSFGWRCLDLFGLTYPSWCVGGDFNVIRRRSEKTGGSGVTSSMRDFDGFIRESELHDPPLRNASFTCQTCRNHRCVRDWIGFSIQMSGSFPSLKAFKKYFLDGHQITGRLSWILIRSSGDQHLLEEILLYFKKLYSSPPGESWRVEGIDWSPISEESASRLDSPFAEAEIFNAIFQLDRDKASGPDGFTIAVFQDCWDVIKEDLVRVFAEFHNSGLLIKTLMLPSYKSIVRASKRSSTRDHPLHSRGGGVVFKIDFEKAYDHVKWDFLDHVLEKKGFSSKWRSWMRGCLSSVSYAILVNGNAKGWVKAARGLRQGDPLSPFLFTIVADVLSRMLLKAEERNLLEGFRVNIDKSNLYGINLDQNHLSRLALLLDCKASDWPILYLGLPLGGNPTACGFWDPVIERISRRLDGWQKALLIFWCRITLLHSCLSHIPSYFLSLFKIPTLVAAKIERMQRDFLWSGVGKVKEIILLGGKQCASRGL
ncbi:hypothetical protein CK203_055322 [Vitis vinifera]|uniref:Reverse transcriptase domain-containing protein n=1 Tax=Vitis vinifera TaxID=29760 RepID=A0A438GV04_VITVI|nr:hypothetical protein CK203_055322 [Vitis vinifera]